MSSTYCQQRTVFVPVQFLADRDVFFGLVAAAGREAGLDHDWVPPSLHEAVYEALISTTHPSESGMIVRPAHMAHGDDVFTTEIYVDLFEEPDAMIKAYSEHLPEGFEPTMDNLMLGLLNSPTAPLDLGFEIIDSQTPWNKPSAHDLIEEADRMTKCRYQGDPGATIFAP